jgi:hypothetical protein
MEKRIEEGIDQSFVVEKNIEEKIQILIDRLKLSEEKK